MQKKGDGNVKAFDAKTFAVSGYTINFAASLVKNCFVTKDDNTYYMDKYGDKLVSSALQIGYVTVAETAGTVHYKFSPASTGAANEYKAYLLFDGKGIARDDVPAGRTASAGSKKYDSTGIAYETQGGAKNAVIFYYHK